MSRSFLTNLIKEAFRQALKDETALVRHTGAGPGSDMPGNEGVSGSGHTLASDRRPAAVGPGNPDADRASRRAFLRQGILGLGVITGAASLTEPFSLLNAAAGLKAAPSATVTPALSGMPVITIIGAGMAGLNFSYQLQKAGLNSSVYESSNRFGGRMFTVSDVFHKGMTTDLGGEWVDEEHYDIKALCREFGVELYDSRHKNLKKHTYYFEGKVIGQQEIYAALLPYYTVLKRDTARLPAEINRSNAAALTDLDALSIIAYLDKIRVRGWLYRFLVLAMESEYGADAADQSAINLLIILRPPQSVKDMDDFEGQGAEVMKIKGGSQQLCRAVYERVKHQVHFEHALTAVHPQGKGFLLSFKSGNTVSQVKTDFLVLTLPFTRLRKVALHIPLPAMKVRAINELGYGNSAKLIMGFKSKPWARMGHIGKLTSDLPFHTGWDSSLMQSDTAGTYTIFSGGKLSGKLKLTLPAELAREFLPELEKVYPGMLSAYNGHSEKFIWETYPHNLGAYSYYKVGQWTSIAGHEVEPVGQLYFAGEHCSQLWQGYMNGAALSARLGAGKLITEIRSKLKVNKS